MAKLRIPRSFKEKDLNRSIYDLSQSKVFTMMQGLNIPCKFEIMKPKDEFTIDYYSMISSMPMVGQQLNDWKLRVMVFKSMLSNYYSWMDNNARLSNEELQGKNHHFISPRLNAVGSATLYDYSDMYPELVDASGNPSYKSYIFEAYCLGVLNSPFVSNTSSTFVPSYEDVLRLGVQPGSLLDFIEFPVGFMVSKEISFDDIYNYSGTTSTSKPYEPGICFNADYILCYLDAVRNYLVNNQLDSVPYFAALPIFDYNMSTGIISVTADRRPYIGTLSLKSIDTFLKYLRMQDNGVDIMYAAYGALYGTDDFLPFVKWLSCLKYGGMFLAQYERDMLNGLLRSVNMEDVRINVAEDGSFSINDFRFANRNQLKKDREGIAGGRWSNLLRTLWGVDSRKGMDIPEIVHTSSYYVSAKSVMSNSNTESSDGSTGSALGQLGGVFDTRDLDAKKCKIFADDHCIMFAIVSLVPDVVYSNGLGKGLDILSFDDEYYPQFDALGFQDVPRYKYNALPKINLTSGQLDPDALDSYNKVVGKNIAFIDLISNVNRVHGEFGNNAYFETWVLKREFFDDVEGASVDTSPDNVDQPRVPSESITSYVNPLAYQYPFTVQSATDPNFIFQIKFDIRAVRSKGKYFMPTLGK